MNVQWLRTNTTLTAIPGSLGFITDRDMQEVQEWCQQNECGRRTSFDTFKFRTQAEITAFLIRWA